MPRKGSDGTKNNMEEARLQGTNIIKIIVEFQRTEKGYEEYTSVQ